MSITREQQRFPTRNYPYRATTLGAAPADAALQQAVDKNVLYRRIAGLDVIPRPMTAEELLGLDDPLGRLLRSGKPFPLTLRALLAAIDALAGTSDALPQQLVFLVADGGHIPWTPETDRLRRGFRFAIARGANDFPLLISASTLIESDVNQAFLQIIGWDTTHSVFNFYERREGTFFWAGMSEHALRDETRGQQGPFDSHVNGAPVMKELRPPWVHWHSTQAGINADALAPNDSLRAEPLFQARVSAERLEREVVRPGIARWNQRRVTRAVAPDGAWQHIDWFMRQVVTETTVNLVTADLASHILTDETPLELPLSFFLNRDVLFDTLSLIPANPDIARIVISGKLYRDCLRRYDVHRFDGEMRVEGDTHFAFLVPEAAFEDTNLIDQMVLKGLASARLIAAISMTDFSNPVFSGRRAALLKHTPASVHGPDPAVELETRFVAAVEGAVAAGGEAASADSPEREFLSNWESAGFTNAFAARIGDYLAALQSGVDDPQVVDGWFRLAEYRRRRFRDRPLAEFRLTTPRTNIPEDAPAMRMTVAGRAEAIPSLQAPPPYV
ncbi:hypothetical protein NKH95_26770 [Mesorhizobium sp. M0848]|uniref:hypothetical protein n=1 Tax=Mesorhizobium sp. M0848 TaxID=2957012 RepID=UPI00333C7367